MSDLITFLRARYDEGEWKARAVKDAAATRTHYRASLTAGAEFDLADLDSKRRILDLHPHLRFATLPEEWPEHWRSEVKPAFPGTERPYVGCERCDFNSNYEVVEPDWWCEHVRLLALPYSNHPDYREEWKP